MKEIRDKLKSLIIEKSVLKGEFKLSSGEISPYYIDARLTTLDPEGVNLISKLFYNEIIKNKEINSVGGETISADPIVGSLISYSFEKGNPLSGFIVRKEKKKHGTLKLIEGEINSDKVVVVDDVITTGGSVLKVIDAIKKETGAVVSKVLVVVSREQEVKNIFEDRGIEFFSIFNATELL